MRRPATKVWLAMVAATTLFLVSTVSVEAYTFTLELLDDWFNVTKATVSEGYGVDPNGYFTPGATTLDSVTAQDKANNPAQAFALLDNERPGRDDSWSSYGKPYVDTYMDLISSVSNGTPWSNVHLDHWGYTEYYFSPYQYDPSVRETYQDYYESAQFSFMSGFTFKLTVASDAGTPGPAQATVSVTEYGFNFYEWAQYTLFDKDYNRLFTWSLGEGDPSAQVALEQGQEYYLYAAFGGGGGAMSYIGLNETGFDETWSRTDYWATLDIDVSEGTGTNDPPGPNPVPEPLSALLVAIGLPGLAVARRRAL